MFSAKFIFRKSSTLATAVTVLMAVTGTVLPFLIMFSDDIIDDHPADEAGKRVYDEGLDHLKLGLGVGSFFLILLSLGGCFYGIRMQGEEEEQQGREYQQV